MKTPRGKAPAGILLVALLAALLACKGGKGKGQAGAIPDTGPGSSQPNATLFYPKEAGGALEACPVSVPPAQDKQQAIEALVRRYLDGPAGEGEYNPFPQGTSVRSSYLIEGGIVAVDLSAPARAGGGTEVEEARVYGLVDTIAFNHPDIAGVRILVEGREVDSLLGHLDLSHPLPPDLSLMPQDARDAFRRSLGGP